MVVGLHKVLGRIATELLRLSELVKLTKLPLRGLHDDARLLRCQPRRALAATNQLQPPFSFLDSQPGCTTVKIPSALPHAGIFDAKKAREIRGGLIVATSQMAPCSVGELMPACCARAYRVQELPKSNLPRPTSWTACTRNPQRRPVAAMGFNT